MTGGDGAFAHEDETPDRLRIDVIRGNPTDDELAALIAVVGEAYSRESADAVVDESSERSAWSVSQRTLRRPLRRELGWGGFAG
jgi:hypothetical protein